MVTKSPGTLTPVLILRWVLILAAALVMTTAPGLARAKGEFIAVIITGNLPRYQQAHGAFMEVLQSGGWGQDRVTVYVQTPNPDPLSWANSIRKAVGVGADLIVTYGAPATLVAKKEARNLPLLFAEVYDPLGLGLIGDLNNPGEGISGVSNKTPIETLLRAFQDIYPGRTLGALYSEADAGTVLQVSELEKAAAHFGIKVLKMAVDNARDVAAACGDLVGRTDSLFVSDSPVLQLRLEEIVAAAAQRRIPIISQIPGLGDRWGLITLEADPAEQGQLIGGQALKLLDADKMALSLPIKTPKKVALVINLRVAKEMNLTVPFQTLSMATRVVR
jgi:putative ABC transport system substrate-binding protein